MDERDWTDDEWYYDKLVNVIYDTIDSAEFDESSKELVLYGPWGANDRLVDERFQSIDDLNPTFLLSEIGLPGSKPRHNYQMKNRLLF